MSLKYLFLVLGVAPAILAAVGCASGGSISDGGTGGSQSDGSGSITGTSGSTSQTGMGSGSTGQTGSAQTGSAQNGTGQASTGASCGDMCDSDGDGVLDGTDTCANTPMGEPVNGVGCSDSQVNPKLHAAFPPYGLVWTPTGDIGRAGGLTWSYAGINRADLFHIYWILCDDPSTPCGVSLDGPVDMTEKWAFSAADSNLAGGKLVFTNATHILLADMTTPALIGRLTLTIVDGNQAALPCASVAGLGVTAQDGQYGAEITGTGFTISALIEVQDSTAVWTPYLDYYDAAATPDSGMGATVSFGGSFYDE